MTRPINDRSVLLQAFKSDPLFFMKTVCPKLYELPFGHIHYCMIHDILANYPEDIIVLLAPRYSAKTKLISVGLALWETLFENTHFIVEMSEANEKAIQNINDITTIIASDEFKSIFGECNGKFWDKRRQYNENEIELFNPEIGLEAKIASRGIDSQVHGWSYKQWRIHRLFADDIEGPDTAFSKTLVDKNTKKIHESFRYALQEHGKRGKIFVIGTFYHHDCTLTRLMDLPTGIRVIRYPGLVDSQDLADRINKIISKYPFCDLPKIKVGQSVWEQMHSTEVVTKKRDDSILNNNLSIFERQIMLIARPEGSTKFPPIKFFEMEDLEEKDLYINITCDMAYSRARHSDKWAINVTARDEAKNIYVLESKSGRGDVSAIKELAETIKKYKQNTVKGWSLRQVNIETLAYHTLRNQIFEILMKNNIAQGIGQCKPANRPKEDRIKSLIWWAEMEKLFIRKNQTGLHSQIQTFSGTEMNEDAEIDALAYQLDIVDFPKRTEMTPEEQAEKRKEVWLKFWEVNESKKLDNTDDRGYHKWGSAYATNSDF